MIKKFDFSKFGNPIQNDSGKKFPLTPTGLKGKFRFITLDPRQFNIPKDWAVMNISSKAEYSNDGKGNAQKTGKTYYRFGLLNGAVARPLVNSGVNLADVSIIPVRCDCFNSNVDASNFKSGDFVKLVKPVFLPQWHATAQGGGSYQGVRLIVNDLKKERASK